MHPENMRKVIAEGIEAYMARHGCSQHTAEQLFSAWATIVHLYDTVPDARQALGGNPVDLERARLRKAFEDGQLTDAQITSMAMHVPVKR